MASNSIGQSEAHPDLDGETLRREPPPWREPTMRDAVRFFVGIPVALGIVFSLVGTRLTHGIPYIDALGYMLIHMFVAWWSVNLGATLIKLCFRNFRPPSITVCLMGLFVSLVPAAFLFQLLGDYYAAQNPVFEINRHDSITPQWSLEYLTHFVRYSFPVLPTFLAGVFGYRAATGVDWYGYKPEQEPATEETSASETAQTAGATAELIDGSKLPADALLKVIKAEQHYIRIWSDQGTDMVRYRFSDLKTVLADTEGMQVHRSWWVNPDFVNATRKDGRKFELVFGGDLVVPVSLAYKSAVLDRLKVVR